MKAGKNPESQAIYMALARGVPVSVWRDDRGRLNVTPSTEAAGPIIFTAGQPVDSPARPSND